MTRLATRWNAEQDAAALRLYMAFLLTQRGSICLYQGEELGLGEVTLDFDSLVDPAGIAFWPAYKGRDGCRTPHPWRHDAAHGGFSTTAPWLPIATEHLALAVDRQEDDPASLLNAYRAFLAFRRHHPALVEGEVVHHPVRDGVMRLERRHDDERLLVALNFTDEPRTLPAPTTITPRDDAPSCVNGRWEAGSVTLPARGIAITSTADGWPDR